MATSRGRSAVARFIGDAPAALERVLVGAARVGGNVVADEARHRSISHEVSENIEVKASSKDGRITVRISVKAGWARSVGIWLEYGTTPHFITVDPNHGSGRSAARVNRLDKGAKEEGRDGPGRSLVINGKFVGETIHHPGARRHPFLRDSLDLKERDAIAAAQNYINSRVTRHGILGGIEPEGD